MAKKEVQRLRNFNRNQHLAHFLIEMLFSELWAILAVPPLNSSQNVGYDEKFQLESILNCSFASQRMYAKYFFLFGLLENENSLK